MNITLYILGQLADVQPQELKGEYNLANVGDLSKRLGSKTNQFTLPPTANNRAIFENANQTLSNTNLPYTMIPCQLLSDGVDMQFAKLILNSSGDYGFKVTLFDTSSSFFDLIKGKNLKDLDLTHLNHHWSVFDIGQFDDYDSPLTYPVTDCQVDSPNDAFPDGSSNVFLGVLLPMVDENYLIEKIVNERGYSIDNKVLNNGTFKDRKPVIPIGVNQFVLDENVDSRYKCKFTLPSKTLSNGNNFVSGVSTSFTQHEQYWTFDQPSTFDYPTYGGGLLFFSDAIEFDIVLSYKIIPNVGASPYPPGVPYFLNTQFSFYEIISILGADTLIYQDRLSFSALDNGNTITHTKRFTVKVDKFTQYFSIDSKYTGRFSLSLSGDINLSTVDIFDVKIEFLNFKYLGSENNKIEHNSDITGGIYGHFYNYITVANNLPKFTQAEFLKEYCLKYGSIIVVNDYRKTVTIRPYKDLFNLANVEDWSGRVDYSDKPEILYQVDKIIGEYFYGDKMEEDPATTKPYPKPIGTDLIIQLGDVVKSDKLELKYDATRTIQKPFTSYTAEIAHIPTFESYGYIGSDKTVCLMMREQTGAFEYKDEAVTGINTNFYTTIGRHFTTYFIESANVFNLGFANDLFNVFYATISKAINDKPIIIKCFMRLGIDKIANFSGENPVYIKELDGYYIVNKIVTSLNTNDSAEVELIKIKL